ncbi:glucosaminidase domain-containing protein [Alicyclobacillus sp. SO9]|uniref:glucosaminidase domain-containing protein n=1 Tax=Alicyclobacillus sp. SO9 TaxID=2665646 RepID=UPI0018E78729|nr:glucosaminidase domain-containing protein [Alicyclobacillus sp. SO9]QQE78984.1 glucosaminidase domain-containing protein [Alicyclobacillus sp. SO9]
MGISNSNVYLYAATDTDFRIAQTAAKLAGVPSGNVIGDFSAAYNLVQNATTNFVLAVGSAALYALYYNPCGWGGLAAGSTPFSYYASAQCSLLRSNMFVNAAGQTPADTFYIAIAFTYYAIHCSYPGVFPSSGLPSRSSPQTVCVGNSNQGCPCSSSVSGGGCNFPSTPPSSCTPTQSAFLNNYLSYAETASSKTGLPVNFILAHWGIETGWGTAAGLCSGCNNPGNLIISGQGTCPCGNVSKFSTMTDGVNEYINVMNTRYSFVKWAYDKYGLKEACMAIGAGCEPASGIASDIYATGRYNGVSYNGQAVSNNCYLSSTIAGNGQAYSTCAPTVANNDGNGCNGCGYVGCSLYETATTGCLAQYNCVTA